MSATYDELLSTPVDRARHALGLTNVRTAAAAIYSDEHIEAVLDQAASFAAGIAQLADALARQYAQKPDSVRLPSGMMVGWKERVTGWRELADRMRAEAQAQAAVGDTTGIGSDAITTQAVW